ASAGRGSLRGGGKAGRGRCGSRKEDSRQAAALRARTHILEALGFQELEEFLAGGAVVPVAVAADNLQEFVGRAVSIARRHLRRSEFEARCMVVGVRGKARFEWRRVDRRGRGDFERGAGAADLRLLRL